MIKNEFDQVLNKRTTKKVEKAVTIKTPIEALTWLSEVACNSELTDKFYKKADIVLDFIEKQTGLSNEDSVFLSVFFQQEGESVMTVNDFAGFFNVSISVIHDKMDVLRKLKRYGLISIDHNVQTMFKSGRLFFSLKTDAYKLLHCDNPYKLRCCMFDCNTFIEQISSAFKEYAGQPEELKAKVLGLVDLVPLRISYCCADLNQLTEDETIIFYYLVANLFSRNRFTINELMDLIVDENKDYVRLSIVGGSFRPTMFSLMEKNSDGTLSLSDETRQLFASILSKDILTVPKGKDILLSKDIKQKDMFYNDTEGEQIRELIHILKKTNFAKVCKRLSSMGMRTGFTCLFYGVPGSGKTETALQLAKSTGRDIYVVDASSIRDKYVGESEKNIKRVFEVYRSMVRDSEKAPILLFNEADAVFGVRGNGLSSSVDKMENAIQDIILQEMESFEGILIATTNLKSNLDSAFERRFLYKVNFEKPSTSVQCKLWKSMIPTLSKATINDLVASYDFSGGQIENVARKYNVNYALKGTFSSDNQLLQYCKDERNDNGRKKVGFASA